MCNYEFSLFFVQLSIMISMALAGYSLGKCGYYFKILIQRTAVLWVLHVAVSAFCKCRTEFRGTVSSPASNCVSWWNYLSCRTGWPGFLFSLLWQFLLVLLRISWKC